MWKRLLKKLWKTAIFKTDRKEKKRNRKIKRKKYQKRKTIKTKLKREKIYFIVFISRVRA
jgi:hypothetical protein